MNIVICSNPDNLRAVNPTATVEAEYGAVCVSGSVATLAHHGPRSNNPAPCNNPDVPVLPEGSTIGLSHVDLDTVGGVMALLGRKPEAPSFWALAEYQDVAGDHKVNETSGSAQDIARLDAYWAFHGENLIFAPRDGSVLDVTDRVLAHVAAVEKALADDAAMLQAGADFRADRDRLNAESFVKLLPGGVMLRQSESFVNHLYATPDGRVARAVVTHNPKLQGVTASLADAVDGIHIGNLLGEFFTPEAGGHAGIGGSERDVARPMSDAVAFADRLGEALGKAG